MHGIPAALMLCHMYWSVLFRSTSAELHLDAVAAVLENTRPSIMRVDSTGTSHEGVCSIDYIVSPKQRAQQQSV